MRRRWLSESSHCPASDKGHTMASSAANHFLIEGATLQLLVRELQSHAGTKAQSLFSVLRADENGCKNLINRRGPLTVSTAGDHWSCVEGLTSVCACWWPGCFLCLAVHSPATASSTVSGSERETRRTTARHHGRRRNAAVPLRPLT